MIEGLKASHLTVVNYEYGLEKLRDPDHKDSWNRAKLLHTHLISGIVCRRMCLEIYPTFREVSALIYKKQWDKMIQTGRSPYFIENRISLGKRKGTCPCRCTVEYIADQYLYGGGTPKVEPNPYLNLRQEEDFDYKYDGEEPEKMIYPPFQFSSSPIQIMEA
jgi:hypothetical protein